MSRIRLVMFLAPWLMIAGCFTYTPVRVSTMQLMQPSQGQAHLASPTADVAKALIALFESRGYPVVDKVDVPNGDKIYVFKGDRKGFTAVVATQYSATAHTTPVGSWFAARLSKKGSGTDVAVLGKPTINGMEVCSDADATLADMRYSCQDKPILDGSPLRELVTGREETEVVRGVLTALSEHLEASKAP